jgi:tRNA dimethylallyltransferase
MMLHTLVVIAGPTAVGKTAMSIEVAKRLKTEILSADSRQFYKELTIGTAKPNHKELAACPHHFINNISLKEQYTAAQFEQEALALCEELFKQHQYLILTGGSGLYIDALCNGFDEAPPSNPSIRAELEEILKNKGIKEIQDLLFQLDPIYAAKVDIFNPQRIMRALEINMISGKNMQFFQKGKPKQRPFNMLKICLTMDRELLYERINDRVDKMVNQGLEDEALAYYHLKNLNALQTVGYKEFFEYFEGKYSYTEAIDKIKQNSRNYAKRQLTWFKRDKSYVWFDINKEKDAILPYILNQTSI